MTDVLTDAQFIHPAETDDLGSDIPEQHEDRSLMRTLAAASLSTLALAGFASKANAMPEQSNSYPNTPVGVAKEFMSLLATGHRADACHLALAQPGCGGAGKPTPGEDLSPYAPISARQEPVGLHLAHAIKRQFGDKKTAMVDVKVHMPVPVCVFTVQKQGKWMINAINTGLPGKNCTQSTTIKDPK
jgi:hypothetical protein